MSSVNNLFLLESKEKKKGYDIIVGRKRKEQRWRMTNHNF